MKNILSLSAVVFLVGWLSNAAAQTSHFEIAGQSLRGYGVSVRVDGTYAYVTMGSAMVVFDISNPNAPQEIGRAYTDNCFDGEPAMATFPGGKYFLASSDLYGVRVFEVTDPTHPKLAFTLFNPRPGERTDPGGGVFVQGNLLYFANGYRGLKIYQAQLSPKGKLTGYTAVGQGYPNPENQTLTDYFTSVFVSEGKAYATSRNMGYFIIDVSNPALPILLGTYGGFLNGTLGSNVEGTVATVSRGFIYGLQDSCAIKTLNVSNPASVSQIACYTDTSTPLFAVEAFRNVSRQGESVAVANFLRGLYLFNIPSSGTPITLTNRWGPGDQMTESGGLSEAILDGSNILLADFKGFRIAQPQGASVSIVGRGDSDLARDLTLVGKIAYLADGSRGVVAVDVTDPTAPSTEQVIAPIELFSYATGIEHQDGYLYVTDQDKGLLVLKLDAPFQASLSATYSTGASPEELTIANGRLYVANGAGGVRAYPISAPGTLGAPVSNPNAITGSVQRVVAYGNWIYAMSDSPGAVTVLDPVTLTQKAQLAIGATSANDISFKQSGSNLYAYVAPTSGAAQIKVLQVTEVAGAVTLQDLGFKPFTALLEFGMGAPIYVRSVEVVGNRLFVVHANSGLYAFSLADPVNPAQESEFLLSANNNTYEFQFRDGFFYNAHGDVGLYIFKYAPPPTACTNDSNCDPYVVCVAGSCVPKASHGAACSRNEVCGSGHCQNGFCCGTGDCCASAADCPAAYASAATCDNPGLCQGSRKEKACSERSECGSTTVSDNSACASIRTCGGGHGCDGCNTSGGKVGAKGRGGSLAGPVDLGVIAALGAGSLARKVWRRRRRSS